MNYLLQPKQKKIVLGKIIATTKKTDDKRTNNYCSTTPSLLASSTCLLAGWFCNWTSPPQKLRPTERNNGSNLRTPTNSQGRRRRRRQPLLLLLLLLQGREMHSASSGESTDNQTLHPIHNKSLALASSNAAAS